MQLKPFLKSIADAIREKESSDGGIPAPDFPQRILDLKSGSGVEVAESTDNTLRYSTNYLLSPDAQSVVVSLSVQILSGGMSSASI